MRTFVAIEIEAESKLITFIGNLKAKLAKDRIKWVNLPVLHQTLFFLGDTAVEEVTSIKSGLAEALSGVHSFEITLEGIGVFGHRRNPKVIWVGIKQSEPLSHLHGIITKTIASLGFTPDKRGFNPHITVGRVKSMNKPGLLYPIVEENRSNLFQKSFVSSVTLFKSELTPQGPIYTPLFRQELQG